MSLNLASLPFILIHIGLPSFLFLTVRALRRCLQALEPSISKEIMILHHTKHHQTYVAGLNAAEESLVKAQASEDVKAAIDLQPALKFNGGGHM
jgi:Fe-Mn family superoxide dismutase